MKTLLLFCLLCVSSSIASPTNSNGLHLGDNNNSSNIPRGSDSAETSNPNLIFTLRDLFRRKINKELEGNNQPANYQENSRKTINSESTSDCQVFNDDAGSLSVLSYTSNMDECLVVRSTEALFLFWGATFSVEGTGSCSFDYVEIYHSFDESSMTGTLLGKYCGYTVPDDPGAAQGPLYVVFHSDQSNNNEGFTLTWSTDDSGFSVGCDWLGNERGYIQSNGYPNNYDSDEDWCKIIDVPFVTLHFVDTFAIEDSRNCNFDYLEITVKNEEPRKFCGSEKPTFLPIEGPVRVKFHSDISREEAGFKLVYGPANDCDVRKGSGEIKSDNYPSAYKSSTRWCVLILEPKVRITFDNYFSLENHPKCGFDSVAITPADGEMVKYCGRTAPIIGELNGPVTIEFSTDRSIVKAGFRLQFSSATDE